MVKSSVFILAAFLCFSKISISSFSEQLDYPGIQSGTTYANYEIEILNPKEKTIVITGLWVRGKWLKIEEKEVSGDPIKVNFSVPYKPILKKKDKTKSPTNKDDVAAIKFRYKGKKKTYFDGVSEISKRESIARP